MTLPCRSYIKLKSAKSISYIIVVVVFCIVFESKDFVMVLNLRCRSFSRSDWFNASSRKCV